MINDEYDYTTEEWDTLGNYYIYYWNKNTTGPVKVIDYWKVGYTNG